MTTAYKPLKIFTQAAGETRRLEIDFTGKMADGDTIQGTPTASVSRLKGRAQAVLSGIAVNTDRTAVSLLVETPARACNYRIDATIRTANGETIIGQALVITRGERSSGA